MPTIRIFDTESDGFVEDATTIWCIGSVDYEEKEEDVRVFDPDSVRSGLDWLWDCDVLVGHNIICHDFPLLKKLYDWEPAPWQSVVDTLVFSRMLHPKRPRPDGYFGKSTHSIEAWGHRVHRAKPDHRDWTKYSEAMAIRCKDDVLINRLVLQALEEEADEEKMFYHKASTKRRPKDRAKDSEDMSGNGAERVPA